MKLLLTLLTGSCLAMASAQLYPMKPGLLESTALRLGDNQFRIALKTSDEQNESITKVFTSHGEKQREYSRQMASAKPDAFTAIQAKIDQLDGSTAKAAMATLTAGQKQRLWEVALQTEGPFALRNGEVSKKVGITPEQKVKIEAIAKRTAAQSDELNAKMGTELEKAKSDKKRTAIVKAYEPKLKAIETKGENELLALLSKVQVDKWRKAKGAPFKV